MPEQSKLWIEYLAVAVEFAAALVVALAAGKAALRPVPLFLRHGMAQQAKVDATAPGRWLALGSRLISCARQFLQASATSASSQPSPQFERALNFFLET